MKNGDVVGRDVEPQLRVGKDQAQRDGDDRGHDQVGQRAGQRDDRLAPPAVCRLYGLTGVGLAQPMKKPPTIALSASRPPPSGSKCASGLRVSRPCQRAVESPSLIGGEGVAELVDREPDEQE